MSVAQAHKKTGVITKEQVTSEQSQKLIKTMLAMSFGCVTFLRGLFPDENFVDQKYIPSRFQKDYDPDSESESLNIKLLTRGKSPQVDLFLDWIDKGATDSIRRGYLSTLSFVIFLDKSNPHDVYEDYSLSFNYQGDEIKVELNNDHDTITILNARKSLELLMRKFILLTQKLEPLPDVKYMTMKLQYNDSCPKDYQPPLFEEFIDDTVSLERATLNTYDVGNFSTGHHNLSLKVRSSLFNRNTSEPAALSGHLRPSVESFANCTQSEIPSETNTMLKSFLEKKDENLNPTQILSDIDCECGSKSDIQNCQLALCASCSKKVHYFCYGIRSSNGLICYSCRAKTLSIELHDGLRLLMNTRKLFRVLMKSNTLPSSLTQIRSLMGNVSLKDVCDSISFFLLRGLIIINTEPVKLKKAQGTSLFRKGSGYFEIDKMGVTFGTTQLTKGTYAFSFVPSLRGPEFLSFKGASTKTKTLLFNDTVDKCLAIDEVLDKILLDDGSSDREDDVIDTSSLVSSPVSRKSISNQFSFLSVKSSQDNTTNDMSLSYSKKRAIRDQEDALEGVESSQPVQTLPRHKKRKSSLAKDVLYSSIHY